MQEQNDSTKITYNPGLFWVVKVNDNIFVCLDNKNKRYMTLKYWGKVDIEFTVSVSYIQDKSEFIQALEKGVAKQISRYGGKDWADPDKLNISAEYFLTQRDLLNYVIENYGEI